MAQRRTFSPYSRYGLGEMSQQGFARNRAMGGTGIALQKTGYLNNMNPAAYSAIDTMSLYFEAGVSGFSQTLKDYNASTGQKNSNFDYFSFGFPISRQIKASLGIEPYTYTGYNVKNTSSLTDINMMQGEGNITRAYGGASIAPLKNLSLGVHANFLFGKQKHTNYNMSLNDNEALSYGIIRDMHVSDVTFDFGAQYLYNFNKKHSFALGVVFSPKTSLSGDLKELKARGVSFNESTGSFNNQYAIDTISYKTQDFRKGELEVPMSYGAGLAYTFNKQLTVTADYHTSQWADVKLPEYATQNNVKLQNSTRIAFGAEYRPDDRLATNYFTRLTYRAGAYRSKDYISFNGRDINETGFSVGLGLPMMRDKSTINLSFTWGTKGSTDNGLIKENFARFTLDISLFEYWFFKQKFD